MKHHEIEQNTDEWMQLRQGKFTASTFRDLFASKTTKAYQNAIYRVVFERLTGEQPESFSNEYMRRGHELEPLARERYEAETFESVEDGGFFCSDWVGASPDGLVGKDGLIEIKCPAYSTMIDYMIKQKLPSIYKWQVHGQMYCTGRKWVDFMSYHPKLKPVIIRIDRDESIISELESKLSESVKEVERIIKLIK